MPWSMTVVNVKLFKMNDQVKTYHEIIVDSDTLIDTSEFIFNTIARRRGEAGSRQLKEDKLTLAELRSFLATQIKYTEEVGGTGDPRLNLPNCQCTNPPSRGFCRYGMCIWGSLNINKGSGSLTITIPF